MTAVGDLSQEGEDRRTEIEELRRRLFKLSEVSRRVMESLDLGSVLQEVVDGARSLTDARYGALAIFDDSGQVREFITAGITLEERRLLGSLPQGLGLLGHLNEIRVPLRLADLAQHPQSVGFPENHPPMKTFLGAPIRHLDEQVGNIYLTEKLGGREFTPEDEETLVLFASQAAMAILNLRFEEERQARSVVEEERARLEALVRTSPVGVLVVDAETRKVVSVNQEAQRIMGLAPEPGSDLERYQRVAIYRRADGSEYKIDDRPMSRALDRGETVRAEEILFDGPDGKTVTTLINATPIYSESGEIASAVAVIQDPGTNGFDLMKHIREVSDVPVIFLSASSEDENIVHALELGADDYIVKPFSPTELVARVEASLRKSANRIEAKGERQPYRLEDVTIDYAERVVTVSGCPVKLTATEYKLLFELSINAGRVMTHEQLLHRVWGARYSIEEYLVRVFVGNLRRKLGDDARNPRYIFTEPRVGYWMARPGA